MEVTCPCKMACQPKHFGRQCTALFSHHSLLSIWDWKYCRGNLSSKPASPADFIRRLTKNANHLPACPLSNSPLIHRFLLPPSKFVGLEVTFPANLWKEKICWCKLHTMYLHVTSSAFSLYLSLFFHFLLCQAPVLSTLWNYHLLTIQHWDYILARFIPSTSNKFYNKLKQKKSNPKLDT